MTETSQINDDATNGERLLSVADVCERTGFSRSTLWRKRRDPEASFPIPVTPLEGQIYWLESELDAWLRNLPRSMTGKKISAAA